MQAPIRYYGGKAKLASWITSLLRPSGLRGALLRLARNSLSGSATSDLRGALMVAAHHAPNPCWPETAMADVCTEVEAEVKPYEHVCPETLALYQKLRKTVV